MSDHARAEAAEAEVREWKRLAIVGNLVALEMRIVEQAKEAADAEVEELKETIAGLKSRLDWMVNQYEP